MSLTTDVKQQKSPGKFRGPVQWNFKYIVTIESGRSEAHTYEFTFLNALESWWTPRKFGYWNKKVFEILLFVSD